MEPSPQETVLYKVHLGKQNPREAWNGKEEFGSARLSALVAKHAKKTAAEMRDEIEKTLRNWAKQHLANDDVTFVIVRVV